MPRKQFIWVAVAAIIISAVSVFFLTSSRGAETNELNFTELQQTVNSGNVKEATIDPGSRSAKLTMKDGTVHTAVLPLDYSEDLANRLVLKKATVDIAPIDGGNPLTSLFFGLLPIFFLGGILIFYMRKTMSIGTGGGNLKGSARIPEVTLDDVAGMPETVHQMRDIAKLVKDYEKYSKAGVEVPAGVLLSGDPGNGKTLMARCLAGELQVPFFAANGSDFVETFIGVGAKRVKELFKAARKAADEHGYAVVFIDEIDAVGRKRASAEASADSQETERTLNALLSELQGFGGKNKLFVLAATNRPDILDPALIRPGRFDKSIIVSNPDRAGREAILQLYADRRTRKGSISLDSDVSLEEFSRRCPGASGADLENLVSEAARVAVNANHSTITREDMEEALATIAIGPERRSAEYTVEETKITAWHEAGHAVAAYLQDHCEHPVQVTIVPRGPAGGITWLQERDTAYATKEQLKADLVVKMAGRAAEELLLDGSYTTGASADFAGATDLARAMVCTFGMSDLGPQVITGQTIALGSTSDRVSGEVDKLLQEAMTGARELLRENQPFFKAVVDTLILEETVHLEDFHRLAAVHDPGN